MTKLLKQAFDEASRLPEEEQDALASLLLDELASERKWDAAFRQSQDVLAALADEAVTEFREGKTLPLDEN